MSDNMVGQIKFTYVEGSREPKIEILGEIPRRAINTLPYFLKRAWRAERARRWKALPKPDMTDKGAKIEDLTKEQFDAIQAEPQPEAAESLTFVPPPADNPAKDQFIQTPEVANTTNDETEKEDAANSRSEEVPGDDAGSGSKEGPSWKK